MIFKGEDPNMRQFGALTKYLPLIELDEIGHWYIDTENDGTLHHPYHFPYVCFSEMVRRFTEDVYAIVDSHSAWELNHYRQILSQNGLSWDSKSMSSAIIDDLDARCICALLVGAVRAERFCDGALMNFFKDGSISRWLKRLEELDEVSSAPVKKVRIISSGHGFGPAPESDEEIEQALTILRDGRIWFNGYVAGTAGKRIRTRRVQFKIPKEASSMILDAFERYFANDQIHEPACDAPAWEMLLADTAGNTKTIIGSATEGYYAVLSNMVRELIPIDDLWILDCGLVSK